VSLSLTSLVHRVVRYPLIFERVRAGPIIAKAGVAVLVCVEDVHRPDAPLGPLVRVTGKDDARDKGPKGMLWEHIREINVKIDIMSPDYGLYRINT
jgi:hypothetical protein